MPRAAALVAALALFVQACSLLRPAPAASPLPPTATPPPAPTNTHAPTGNGTITGQLGYPGEAIPAMTLYFQNVDTADVLTLSTRDNQSTYSKSLPPGTYYVYAWLPDFGLGGSYSAAVPCGLTLDCADHSLLPVEVAPGGDTTGIDLLDWYGPPGSIPLPAGVSQGTGAIEGRLHFPSEGIPPLVVYARNVATGATFGIATAENQPTFTLSDLPPGVYHVFAWVSDGNGLGGAYTQAVVCGLTAECTDHALIAVPVPAGRTTTGIDIADWYDQSVVPLP
jgi:hypothetical protein